MDTCQHLPSNTPTHWTKIKENNHYLQRQFFTVCDSSSDSFDRFCLNFFPGADHRERIRIQTVLSSTRHHDPGTKHLHSLNGSFCGVIHSNNTIKECRSILLVQNKNKNHCYPSMSRLASYVFCFV